MPALNQSELLAVQQYRNLIGPRWKNKLREVARSSADRECIIRQQLRRPLGHVAQTLVLLLDMEGAAWLDDPELMQKVDGHAV